MTRTPDTDKPIIGDPGDECDCSLHRAGASLAPDPGKAPQVKRVPAPGRAPWAGALRRSVRLVQPGHFLKDTP